jgi:hypothetical protein
MGGFFNDLWSGIKDAGTTVYDSAIKPVWNKAYDMAGKTLNRFENVQNGVDKLTEAGIGAGTNVLDFLGGKSNFLVYAGVVVIAVVILPKLIEKVL